MNVTKIEGDGLKYEQLSFLKPIKKTTKKLEPKPIYGPGICHRCRCNRCRYSVAIYPHLDKEEREKLKGSCWNCEDCYYYGMDDEKLSQDIVRFECNQFEMSNHYMELIARRRRNNFKIIKGNGC